MWIRVLSLLCSPGVTFCLRLLVRAHIEKLENIWEHYAKSISLALFEAYPPTLLRPTLKRRALSCPVPGSKSSFHLSSISKWDTAQDSWHAIMMPFRLNLSRFCWFVMRRPLCGLDHVVRSGHWNEPPLQHTHLDMGHCWLPLFLKHCPMCPHLQQWGVLVVLRGS